MNNEYNIIKYYKNIILIYLQIYKTLIREEEYKTGQPSKRKYDVTAKEALSDEETKRMYINRKY